VISFLDAILSLAPDAIPIDRHSAGNQIIDLVNGSVPLNPDKELGHLSAPIRAAFILVD
jgi:hypothetical protein